VIIITNLMNFYCYNLVLEKRGLICELFKMRDVVQLFITHLNSRIQRRESLFMYIFN